MKQAFVMTSCLYFFLINCHEGTSDKARTTGPENEVVTNLSINTGVKNADSCIWLDTLHGLSVVRRLDNGFYKILFWKNELNSAKEYYSDSIAVFDFLKDSLYDVNGDGMKDYLVYCQNRNGQCQPEYAKLYCFDIASNLLRQISEIERIPNPRFNPRDKSVVGKIECLMKKDSYRFKWKGISLDTVFIKTKPLHNE